MSTFTLPDRSLEQRRTALQEANRVRSYRARVKRDLKAGRAVLYTVLCDPDCSTMKIGEAVRAQPKFGRIKTEKVLRRAVISPSKTIGGLTERQRVAIVAELRARG